MSRLYRLSIRTQLLLVMMLVAGTAVIVACALLVALQISSYRSSQERALVAVADIVGANCAASLEFEDRNAADEILRALAAKPSVVVACIYGADGKVFSTYVNGRVGRAILPPPPGALGSRYEKGYLVVCRRVTHGQREIGTVFVQGDLSELDALMKWNVLALLFSVAVALTMALLLAYYLRRTVSTPIRNLAGVVQDISRTKDYSIRAVGYGCDEIRQLVSGFNGMLNEIEARDAELSRLNDSLEVRVRERTAELTSEVRQRKSAEFRLRVHAEHLERSNRELQDFAYITSHDLQEPLRKIQAFGDRLQAKCADQIGEQGLDYLGRMLNASHRMRNLISALLDYSRVTTKVNPFAQVSLEQVVREVLSDLEIQIAQSSAVVEVGVLPTIEADEWQMRQLFQNLIGNAIKYRKADRAPVIRIGAKAVAECGDESCGQDCAVCEIRVEDNGIGFDPKYSERIFGVFQRLHGRGEFEGAGVGLAICRKIVQRHHGSIRAEGKPDEGSIFMVTLPLKQAKEENNEEGALESKSER